LIDQIDSDIIDYEPKGSEEGFTSTHLKEARSVQAQFRRLKFKSEALKSRLTRKLLAAGNALGTDQRPLNYYKLKDMVDAENKSTITKRRKSSANTVKLTNEYRNQIARKMQELKTFTITDSDSEEATLAFNKNSGMNEKFSRSQLESVVKSQIQNGFLKKTKNKEGKAVIFEKRRK